MMRTLSPKVIKAMLVAILKNKDILISFSNEEIKFLSKLNLTQIQKFGFSAEEAIRICYPTHEEDSLRSISG